MMSTMALVVGLILGAQVAGGGDRYSTSDSPGAANNNQSLGELLGGGQRDGDVVTPLESQPSGRGAAATSPAPPPAALTPLSPGNPQTPIGQNGAPSGAASPAKRAVSPPPGVGSYPSQSPGQAPPPESNPPQPAAKPSALMRIMLMPPQDAQLPGRPTPLADVLASAPTRLEQSQRIDAYWDLCSSVADYYLGLRERDELQRLRSLFTGAGAGWQEAETELSVRLATAQRAARASQLRLANWLARGTNDLPLPADMPHCGSYHSKYEAIFAGRNAPEAQQLAELLPQRYAELKVAAAAVARAEDWLNNVARNDNASGTGTLRAAEFLALRRRAFVQIARDYNRRIARYAELASPGEIGADRLIGILIKTEHNSTATRSSSPTPPPRRQSSTTSDGPPQTFAGNEGWESADDRSIDPRRDDAVRPAAGQTPRVERSLLVPRR